MNISPSGLLSRLNESYREEMLDIASDPNPQSVYRKLIERIAAILICSEDYVAIKDAIGKSEMLRCMTQYKMQNDVLFRSQVESLVRFTMDLLKEKK